MDENWKKEFSTTNGSARVQSILEGNVHRCVNISTGEIDALIHKLSEIHNLVDQAIKERSRQISDETERVLSQIITDTQIEQQRLLSFAEQRQVIEDKLYREELQSFVKQLDERKARALAELQEELKKCREEIFEDSQTKVRRVNEQAQRVKQAILFEEQDKAEVQIQSILTQIQRASIDENLQHVGSESFSETLVTSQADVGTKAPGQNCKFTPVLTLNKKTSKWSFGTFLFQDDDIVSFILGIYTEITGDLVYEDHHRCVCWRHCPSNLRILPRKNNRWTVSRSNEGDFVLTSISGFHRSSSLLFLILFHRAKASSIEMMFAKWAVLGMPRHRIPWACRHS